MMYSALDIHSYFSVGGLALGGDVYNFLIEPVEDVAGGGVELLQATYDSLDDLMTGLGLLALKLLRRKTMFRRRFGRAMLVGQRARC